MELLMNSDYYVLVIDKYSLWCSKSDGSLIPKDGMSILRNYVFLVSNRFYALLNVSRITVPN